MLKDTLGAIVFQDQVLEVSMALAGFSVGEAEGLRRAMSRKRSQAAMERYRERFIEGAIDRGVSREVAERVFGQIEGFSGFGFPKSHSAAFGLLAYQSMWLRVHYGPELLCALLNEQPMGFYPPDALVHEAQRRGLEILSPDVNVSELDCRVETTGAAAGSAGNPPVRIGLGYVAEVAEVDAQAVIDERRRGGSYRSISDLAGRSGAGAASLQRFAWAGACDGLVQAGHAIPADPDDELRRPALWEVGGSARAARTDDGAQLALPLDGSPTPPLPQLGPWERIVADYRTTGMTLGRHPMELIRENLTPDVLSSDGIGRTRDGARVKVAGMVVARQRPSTANGVVFMLLEDERGTINLIIPPPVVERCRLAVRTSGFVLAAGKLEHREGTTNVVVDPDRPPQHRRAAASADPRTRAARAQGNRPGSRARARDGRPFSRRTLQARFRRRPRGGDGGAGRLAPGPAQLRAPWALERPDRRDDLGEVSPLVEMPVAVERPDRGVRQPLRVALEARERDFLVVAAVEEDGRRQPRALSRPALRQGPLLLPVARSPVRGGGGDQARDLLVEAHLGAVLERDGAAQRVTEDDHLALQRIELRREAIPPRLVVRLVLGARHHREEDLEVPSQLVPQATDERLAALAWPLRSGAVNDQHRAGHG